MQALGISVLGGHEDMATARLTFASGCVAQLSASRVSFQQQRTMTIFTSRGSASINFATHEATVVKPRDDVLRREFRVDRTLGRRARVLERASVRRTAGAHASIKPPAVNAIQEEQRDFVRRFATASRRASMAWPAATRLPWPR